MRSVVITPAFVSLEENAMTTEELAKMANTIRQDIIKMLVEAGSGHSAGPLGMADVFAAMYFVVLKHDPKNPDWPERDRLTKLLY